VAFAVDPQVYGDEVFDGFACYFTDEIGLPRSGLVIGEDVQVVDVLFDGDERRGLSARCVRNGESHDVALLDVVFAPGSDESPAVAAYRQWLELDPWPWVARKKA
jgi:hypothetical protein